eukprot:6480038-Amphidinium_carterae.1
MNKYKQTNNHAQNHKASQDKQQTLNLRYMCAQQGLFLVWGFCLSVLLARCVFATEFIEERKRMTARLAHDKE